MDSTLLMTTLNLIIGAKPLECLTDKLGSVVMDNQSWDTEAIDDIEFDELSHIGGFNFLSGIATAHFEK